MDEALWGGIKGVHRKVCTLFRVSKGNTILRTTHRGEKTTEETAARQRSDRGQMKALRRQGCGLASSAISRAPSPRPS
ncbi:MAG: hypothetical protein CR964_00775 [Rhodobacterales bacterium]|nr:MAG: hypothetical protein CR964_00775 [Rhodobacterales bacterium]